MFSIFEKAVTEVFHTSVEIPHSVIPLTQRERDWLDSQSIHGLIPKIESGPVFYFQKNLFINLACGLGTQAIVSAIPDFSSKKSVAPAIELEQETPSLTDWSVEEAQELNPLIENAVNERIVAQDMQEYIERKSKDLTQELHSTVGKSAQNLSHHKAGHSDYVKLAEAVIKTGEAELKNEIKKGMGSLVKEELTRRGKIEARTLLESMKKQEKNAARTVSFSGKISTLEANEINRRINALYKSEFNLQVHIKASAVTAAIQGATEFFYQTVTAENPFNVPENLVNTGIEIAKELTLKAFSKVAAGPTLLMAGVFGDATSLGTKDTFYDGPAPSLKLK